MKQDVLEGILVLLHRMWTQDDVFRHSCLVRMVKTDICNRHTPTGQPTSVWDDVHARRLFKPRLSFTGLANLDIFLVERPTYLVMCLKFPLPVLPVVPTQGRRDSEAAWCRRRDFSAALLWPSENSIQHADLWLLPESEADRTTKLLPFLGGGGTSSLWLDVYWLFSDAISTKVYTLSSSDMRGTKDRKEKH
jgi:hypothetical protein